MAVKEAIVCRRRRFSGWEILAILLLASGSGAGERTKSRSEMIRFMAEARAEGRASRAQKTRPVDARPAHPGEVIVTVIKGQGVETRSRPAEAGDWVVRNRCTETGNEEYLVAAKSFKDAYQPTGVPVGGAWREFQPRSSPRLYTLVREADGEFTFVAPWGESMVARPGDAIVQDASDERDIFRVEARSFSCTYELID